MNVKLFLSFSIAVVFLSIPVSAQKWIWRNPYPHGAEIVDMITKGDTVFASSRLDVFSFSTDAGKTWEVRTHDSIQEGGKMAFLDDRTLVMSMRSEQGQLAMTSDWGKNWKIFRFGSSNPSPPSDAPFVKFFDPQNGLVIEVEAPIRRWRTNDGGVSWSEQELQYDGTSISFISDNELFIGGSNIDPITKQRIARLLFSDDRLVTWKEINTLPSGIKQVVSVSFESKSKGIIVTDKGLYRTTDGGAAWTSVSMNPYNPNSVRSVYDKQSGYYFLMHGFGFNDYNVSRSTDGGNSWIPVLYNIPDGSLIRNMHTDAHSILYAYGYGGALYKSSDQGIVWNRIHGIGPTFHLASIHFTDSKNGTAFTSGNMYAVTSNSGITWDERSLSGGRQFVSVDFYNSESGYALTRSSGGGYFLLSTSDGGFTWDSVSQVPVKQYFIKGIGRPTVMKAVGPGRVWIAAQWGTMYHTTDNGLSWEVCYVFPDYLTYVDDHSIFAMDDAHIWFTQKHLLTISSDSMKTFFIVDPTSLKYPQPQTMSIHLISLQDGWMSGTWSGFGNPYGQEWEFLLKTNNGGEDWEVVPGIGGQKISFYNDKLFLLYGQTTDGYPLYITEDGGSTWTSFRSPYNSRMKAMIIVDKNRCWGVGLNGMIMELKR